MISKMPKAAFDLYGDGIAQQVGQAWDSVGVGEPF